MVKLLTPYMLNTIDCCEARVVDYPKYINGELTFSCGGIVLPGKKFFGRDEFLKMNTITEQDKDMYLSGICRFKFTEIISYTIELSDQSGFIKGKTEIISKNEERASFASAVFPTMILCDPCSEYPPEYIEIVVETRNPIEMSFNDSDLIYNSELFKSRENYEKYAFRDK